MDIHPGGTSRKAPGLGSVTTLVVSAFVQGDAIP